MYPNKYYSFENDSIEILYVNHKYLVIKDKKKNKYYFEHKKKQLFNDLNFSIRYNKVSNTFFFIYISLLTIFLTITIIGVLLYKTTLDKTFCKDFGVPLIYISINIMLHECGHICSLKYFGRKIGKIGLKFNYIFPCIFVNMNECYMLTKSEKIICHSMGIFINSMFNFICIILYLNTNMLIYYNMFYVLGVGIIYNFLPFLNSDGYKVLISLLNINEYKIKKYNNRFIKTIKLINSIFVFFYIVLSIFKFFNI